MAHLQFRISHWKRPWCWERLKIGREACDRGWDGQMASVTWWTWVWASSGKWWRTGKPDVLQSLGSQSQTCLRDRTTMWSLGRLPLSFLFFCDEDQCWKLSPKGGNINVYKHTFHILIWIQQINLFTGLPDEDRERFSNYAYIDGRSVLAVLL